MSAPPGRPSSSLARSSATIAGLTLLFSGISLLREQATAFRFGAAAESEAFVIGNALPAFFISTVSGILGPAFMPLLIEVRHREGKASAERLLAAAASTALLAGLVMGGLLAVTAQWSLPALAAGFDAERLQLSQRLLHLLVPAVAVSSLSYLWTSVLNADEAYWVGAFAPSLQPLGALIGLFAVPGVNGVQGMAVGMTAGAFAQMLVLGWAVRRAGWPIGLAAPWSSERIGEFRQHYGTLFIGALLMGATTLVNQSLATRVSAGAAAYLNYASVAVLFVVGMGARTVGQLVLPRFSAEAAAGQWPELLRQGRRALTLVWWTSLPVTLLLVATARPVTSLLFERGAFTSSDSDVVVSVTRALALQIPWYLANIVAVRLLSAVQLNRAILVVAAANLLLTIAVNASLYSAFGLVGIAVGTALVYGFSFAACWMLAVRHIRTLSER